MSGLTADARRRLAAQGYEEQISQLWEHLQQLKADSLKEHRELKSLQKEAQLIAEVKAARSQLAPPLVQNLDSGVWHRVLDDSAPAWAAGARRTFCGWRVGSTAARLMGAAELPRDTPESQGCDRCFG